MEGPPDDETECQTHFLVEVDPNISFSSIGGLDEQKQKLIEAVRYRVRCVLQTGTERRTGDTAFQASDSV
jgi:hypothetical protein